MIERADGPWLRRLFWLLPAIALLLIAWLQRPDGRLHLYLLNTPGEAALVQTPAGGFVLIDGGSDPGLLTLLLGQHMPFWQRGLVATVLTLADSAHLPGQVAALARYRPGMLYAPTGLPRSGAGGEWRRLAVVGSIPARPLRPGQQLDLGGGVSLRVLGVAPGEQGGAVLLLDYGTTHVLLHTGGPLGDSAAGLAIGQPITAMAYPWQRELDTPLIADLRPQAIIFTSAYEATTPALLSYAERRHFSPAVYHENNDGSIELVSDGKRAWVLTEN